MAESKFIHLNRPTEMNGTTCVERQYFMTDLCGYAEVSKSFAIYFNKALFHPSPARMFWAVEDHCSQPFKLSAWMKRKNK